MTVASETVWVVVFLIALCVLLAIGEYRTAVIAIGAFLTGFAIGRIHREADRRLAERRGGT